MGSNKKVSLKAIWKTAFLRENILRRHFLKVQDKARHELVFLMGSIMYVILSNCFFEVNLILFMIEMAMTCWLLYSAYWSRAAFEAVKTAFTRYKDLNAAIEKIYGQEDTTERMRIQRESNALGDLYDKFTVPKDPELDAACNEQFDTLLAQIAKK